jgi:CheY-like chemotaxis protein
MPLPRSESPPLPATSGSFKILVVDDNVDALEMLVEALNMLGYEAYPAADVKSALRLALEKRPDLALLDIGLPDMDGYELGQRLRQLPGLDGLRLVALTGYGQTSDRARSHSLGFTAHLVKPVDLNALSALLRGLAS